MNATVILGMIALFIILIISTPSYIDSSAVQAWKQSQDISSSISGLSVSKDNYQTLNNTPLTVANWRTEIESLGRPIPTYGSAQWFYGENGNGSYFCLRVNGSMVSSRWYRTLSKSKDRSGFFSFVNENCGAVSDFASTPDFDVVPSISLTAYMGD